MPSSIAAANSSAAPSGTTLTLTLHLTYTPSFVGPKTIAMRATSVRGPTTGWLPRGAWTVGAIVEAISVTPNSGTGMTQTFTAAFSDSLGEVALIPGTGGNFEIRVGEALVWERKRDGGFPGPKELKQRVRDIIEPERDLGHTDRAGSDHP